MYGVWWRKREDFIFTVYKPLNIISLTTKLGLHNPVIPFNHKGDRPQMDQDYNL